MAADESTTTPPHPYAKLKVGHPPIFKNPEEMQVKINEYFKSCYKYDYVLSNYGIIKNPEWDQWEKEKHSDTEEKNPHDKYKKEWQQIEQPTLSGLAVALGVDRKTVLNYSNRSEFFPTISHARSLIEKEVVLKLFDKGAANGAKFNLMNNFGHKERSEIETKELPTTNADAFEHLKIIAQQEGISLQALCEREGIEFDL